MIRRSICIWRDRGWLDDLGDERLRLMDETGVDVQVLSLTTPSLHNLDSGSVSLAAHQRSHRRDGGGTSGSLSGAGRAADRRAGRGVARAQRSARDLGLKGAMLCGRTRRQEPRSPGFLADFRGRGGAWRADFHSSAIPQRAVREVYYSGFGDQVDLAFSTFGLGWHYEAGISSCVWRWLASSIAFRSFRSFWGTGEKWFSSTSSGCPR